MHNSSTAGRKGPDTDPWSSDKGNQISSDYRTALVGPGISASAIGITALVRALLVPAELEQPGVKRARKLQASSLTAGPG